MNPELRKRFLFMLAAIAAGILAFIAFRPLSHAPMKTVQTEKSFEAFYSEKLKISQEKGVRPGNEERLVRFATRTRVAFLYIHGYGASRAEGEEVLDRVAEKFRANTYYMRLPGHGTNPEDHAATTYQAYLDAVEEAYMMTRLLGDRVIIVGTSMGGLLGTYLGSRHPEIEGLILVSPFFDFDTWAGHLANEPGGMILMETINGGPYRKTAREPNNPNDTRIEGYQDFWYTKQYLKALRSLEDTREYVARRGTYEKISMPVLMLYYYRNEELRDKSASVPAMLEAFHQFGTLERANQRPNPLNRAIAIEKGNHVLLSRWVDADHERCYQEIVRFVEDVQGKK